MYLDHKAAMYFCEFSYTLVVFPLEIIVSIFLCFREENNNHEEEEVVLRSVISQAKFGKKKKINQSINRVNTTVANQKSNLTLNVLF